MLNTFLAIYWFTLPELMMMFGFITFMTVENVVINVKLKKEKNKKLNNELSESDRNSIINYDFYDEYF